MVELETGGGAKRKQAAVRMPVYYPLPKKLSTTAYMNDFPKHKPDSKVRGVVNNLEIEANKSFTKIREANAFPQGELPTTATTYKDV
jgi:hypothetical protein